MRLVNAATRALSPSAFILLNTRFKYIACFEEVANRGSKREAYNAL